MTIQHINAETGEILTTTQVERIMARPKRWGRSDKPRHTESELRRRKSRQLARSLRQDVTVAVVTALVIVGLYISR